MLGTVVATAKVDAGPASTALPVPDKDDIETSEEDYMVLVLDDGTNVVHCFTPMAMIERVAVRIGQVYDCIGELRTTSPSSDCSCSNDISQHLHIMVVDTLLQVRTDQAALERLRWMEICASSDTFITSQKIDWCGYPCPPVSCDDIFDLIQSNNCEGATIAELALVLDMEEPQVLAMVEELQIQGQIYQNERNNYVPL